LREKKPNNGSCGEKLAATKIEKGITKGREGDISAIVSAPKGGEQEAFSQSREKRRDFIERVRDLLCDSEERSAWSDVVLLRCRIASHIFSRNLLFR